MTAAALHHLLAWSIFYNPLPLQTSVVLWLVLPLCLAVAIIYKTVRAQNLNRLWLDIALVMLYIVVGLSALGGGLWLIQAYWP